MNDTALALEEQLGFSYASDTRGNGPFMPLIAGRRGRVPQLPTTLPTLDELIGLDGVHDGQRARRLAGAQREARHKRRTCSRCTRNSRA